MNVALGLASLVSYATLNANESSALSAGGIDNKQSAIMAARLMTNTFPVAAQAKTKVKLSV